MSKKNIIIPIITFVLGVYFGFYIPHKSENITPNQKSEEQKNIEQPTPNEQKETSANPDTFPKIPDAKADNYGFPIIPQGNARKYIKEASEFLTLCSVPDKDRQACINEQARFEQEYVNAYSGDYLAQSNIAYMLWKAPSGFMPGNKRQACSWRLVIMTSGSPYLNDLDMEKSKEICDGIDPKDPGVISRARAIQDIVKSHKVKPIPVPAIEYDPLHDKDETNGGEGE